MRALFFGTPAIAVPALDALAEIADIVAVICQPDRPAGRGLELKAPPVKARALERGLEVLQPTKIRTEEFAKLIRDAHAEFALVMAYGRILPPSILNAPAKGCINLHASLLPKLRGAAPIQWAVARGERETGITLMQMDEGCDTGALFCTRSIALGENETAGELADRLGELAAIMVRDELRRALAGDLVAKPQLEAEATMAPMLTKEDGAVDWTSTATSVHNRARGMSPWPGAHTLLDGKRFKILSLRMAAQDGEEGAPGEVLAVESAGARIACGSGSVWLLRGQVEGKKPLDAEQLLAGRTLSIGSRFATSLPT